MVLLLSVAGAPTPAESPALHEIGRQASPGRVCGPLVVHANAAIAVELRNRLRLGQTIALLRTTDLETDDAARTNALSELNGLSAELHQNAERGDDELRRLGVAAERLPPEADAAGLRSFKQALAAAFAEERRTALDLAAFVHFLDYLKLHEIQPGVDDPNRPGDPGPFGRGPSTGELLAAGPSSPYQRAGSPNRMLRAAASDFSSRLLDIDGLEARAAGNSEQAVTGCS